MTIRLRLTILVALATAVLTAVALGLGLAVLRDVAAQGALDQQVEELTLWLDAESEFAAEVPLVDEAAGDEFAYSQDEAIAAVSYDLGSMFQASEDWPASIPPDTTEQLINEFGSDDTMWVSPIGLFGLEVDVGDLVWPVDDEGRIRVPISAEDTPPESTIISASTLLELVDYPGLNSIEFPSDDGTDVEPVIDARLAFTRVTLDGVTYGLAVDAAEEWSAIDSISGVLWSAAIALTVLAAFGTWIISGRALAPVGAMTDKADLLSSTDLRERLPGSDRNDEIGRLAATLNRMLGRLEASDGQRRRFVSDASHELRTPLAVLGNQADVARSAPDSTSLDDLARVVQSETGRMAAIVEDLLLLARHDEEAVGVSAASGGSTEFDLDDVVLTEIARPRRLPVDGSAVSAGRVRGDSVAAARAVGHLLDNAARHGRSAIAVGLSTVGDQVHLTVDDDGDGIPEARHIEVFERFTRLDDSRTRDRGGAGLGLSVVKATVSAMGGTVAVDRSPLGGARFRITLPAA